MPRPLACRDQRLTGRHASVRETLPTQIQAADGRYVNTGAQPRRASEFEAVLQWLDELGLRENTLVIFLGDNGTGVEVVSQFKGKPYPGGKGTGTARGNHVPLIVNWPGRVSAGKVNSDLVGSVDFLPTICEVGVTSGGECWTRGWDRVPQY